jgi:hypothetical protein
LRGGVRKLYWESFLARRLSFERTAIGAPVSTAHVKRSVCE